ncbi:hypothetical protein KL86PLE_90764 [uncultured Pleomorphomonas sp.]|uniref:Uncharacterized protein n=1 Tax=uncultured Pleomorphomonas sp. TaxID=442121 RepID=A0A212LR32_9HYPH|nr:hypothetical protein KL86PLE_90764 [uncultured Pleomorphomonas sp.]
MAALAWAGEPVHRPCVVILRIRRYQASQDPDVVRPR